MQWRTWQTHHQRKRLKSVNRRMKRLRVEMKEISEGQREIKVGQKKVREKFEAIELECEELRKETILITQQTANTQIRLALMFQILKARQNQELDKATILTHALRDLIESGNQQRKL
ncbi:hypothetical protein E1A91_D01G107100v1 [Gossypium mustelinum]|uniref:Uncharacterized protein n=1 Tax=Gossypium mustelinum TaxID=34275 RepID=A0A5D2W5I8_GOSMU|nr:hypothetical protein E1A91_D01G107100v1 [Gossypium mustelinum]TYI96911.1 hypothetical protein E1A91_D01G107100v1 [Gossypium mustelinum]